MGFQDSTLFKPTDVAPWIVPEVTVSRTIWFGESQNIITLHPFTITSVNSTPTIANVGGRPCVQFAGAGAATDGNNLCYGAAGILLQAGKPIIIRGSLRSADITNHEFVWGAGVVGTGVIATDPTDHVMIRKLLGLTIPQVRSRKGSGTANAVDLNTGTLANDTWYDFSMRFTVDALTSGAGKAEVWWGAGLLPGQAMTKIYDNSFGTNVPNSIKIAPLCGWRAGSTVTTAMNFGHYSYEVAR